MIGDAEPIADVDIPPVVDEGEEIDEKELEVRNWRLRELVRMDVTLDVAIEAAKTRGLDIHEVFTLIEQGATPDVAVRIAKPL